MVIFFKLIRELEVEKQKINSFYFIVFISIGSLLFEMQAFPFEQSIMSNLEFLNGHSGKT